MRVELHDLLAKGAQVEHEDGSAAGVASEYPCMCMRAQSLSQAILIVRMISKVSHALLTNGTAIAEEGDQEQHNVPPVFLKPSSALIALQCTSAG